MKKVNVGRTFHRVLVECSKRRSPGVLGRNQPERAGIDSPDSPRGALNPRSWKRLARTGPVGGNVAGERHASPKKPPHSRGGVVTVVPRRLHERSLDSRPRFGRERIVARPVFLGRGVPAVQGRARNWSWRRNRRQERQTRVWPRTARRSARPSGSSSSREARTDASSQ